VRRSALVSVNDDDAKAMEVCYVLAFDVRITPLHAVSSICDKQGTRSARGHSSGCDDSSAGAYKHPLGHACIRSVQPCLTCSADCFNTQHRARAFCVRTPMNECLAASSDSLAPQATQRLVLVLQQAPFGDLLSNMTPDEVCRSFKFMTYVYMRQ
jgi:hypothetical protein